MKLLEKRSYTKQELKELLQTEQPCRIRDKLNSYGYIYTENGRGNNYTITITEITNTTLFRHKAVEELGFQEQTDFKRLRKFLRHFFLDEGFQELTYEEMAEFLIREEKEPPCLKTIKSYCDTLYKHDYFSLVTKYTYTAYIDQEKVELSEEEYKSFYNFFFNGIEEKMKKNEKMKISLKTFGYSLPPRKRPIKDVLISPWDGWKEILIPNEEEM